MQAYIKCGKCQSWVKHSEDESETHFCYFGEDILIETEADDKDVELKEIFVGERRKLDVYIPK